MRFGIACLWLLCGIAAMAEEQESRTLPEGAVVAEVAYRATISDAKDKLRSELEAESEKARQAGDLMTALAIKDRIVELNAQANASLPGIPLGKFSILYSNKVTRRYDFSEPGSVSFVAESGVGGPAKPLPQPISTRVFWRYDGESIVGYAYWPQKEGSGKVERFTVSNGKILSELFAPEAMVSGAGQRSR